MRLIAQGPACAACKLGCAFEAGKLAAGTRRPGRFPLFPSDREARAPALRDDLPCSAACCLVRRGCRNQPGPVVRCAGPPTLPGAAKARPSATSGAHVLALSFAPFLLLTEAQQAEGSAQSRAWIAPQTRRAARGPQKRGPRSGWGGTVPLFIEVGVRSSKALVDPKAAQRAALWVAGAVAPLQLSRALCLAAGSCAPVGVLFRGYDKHKVAQRAALWVAGAVAPLQLSRALCSKLKGEREKARKRKGEKGVP